MKKNVANKLAASVNEERKAVKAKTAHVENRFAKAEAVLSGDQDIFKKKAPKKIIKEQAKVIRDTFSFPESDHYLLNECKNRALTVQYVINKSEVVRAGLIALRNLPENKFIDALKLVTKVKTGRPKP